MVVACDLGYPCAKFRLPRPFGFRVRADVRDIRQTDGRTDVRTTDADDRLMPPLRGWGIINVTMMMLMIMMMMIVMKIGSLFNNLSRYGYDMIR